MPHYPVPNLYVLCLSVQVEYSFSPNCDRENCGLFSIDRNTGDITLTSRLDDDKDIYTLYVEAIDGNSNMPMDQRKKAASMYLVLCIFVQHILDQLYSKNSFSERNCSSEKLG